VSSAFFQNLFCNDSEDALKDYDLQRISDEAVLVTRGGEPWMVVLVGEEAKLSGQSDASMLAFTRDCLWAADVRDLGGQLVAAQPVGVQVQTSPARVTVIGPEELGSVTVREVPLMLEGGRLETDLGEGAANLVALGGAFDRYAALANAPGTAPAVEVPAVPALMAERSLEVPNRGGRCRRSGGQAAPG